MEALLETAGLSRAFGGLVAVRDVDFSLPEGAREALIGPNGAGKTTFINLLTGVLPPSAGAIRFAGQDITRLSAHARVRRGIARTFQINQLFDDMTPLEAVMLAILEREGQADSIARPLWRQTRIVDEAAALLARCNLADAMDRRTAEIAYGRRRQLEIALALAC